MTSEVDYDEAFVWTWLPGETAPVVAGRLARVPDQLEPQYVFNYGRSYLARKDAIPLYEPELPLKPGALDFQRSATNYVPRQTATAKLTELLDAADSVERGVPLSTELDAALLHGSSIGGARPKAMITSENRKFVAKFSSQTDLYSVV